METRDGASSQPVVESYRSTTPQVPLAMAQQPAREQDDGTAALKTSLEPALEPAFRLTDTSGVRQHPSAPRGGSSSTILKPSCREPFELPESLSPLQDHMHSLHTQWVRLHPWSSDTASKEMLAIVRRGQDCFYEVDEVPDTGQVLEGDVRLYARQLPAWKRKRSADSCRRALHPT